MKHDFSNYASINAVFDDEKEVLIVDSDTVIEDPSVRRMKDMRNLFVDSRGFTDETALYYMYNGIYRPQHKVFFKDQHIKYEFTILLNKSINGECIKAHGHIHGINPIRKARHVEAYEILYGKGYFELFTYKGDDLHVVMIEVKQGDYLMIPPDYYHLSINTGDVPFIFGDLIVEGAGSEYGYLKEKNGAPLFAMKDKQGNLEFKANQNYADAKLFISYVTADTVPWDVPLAKIPLYAHFISNPERFAILK